MFNKLKWKFIVSTYSLDDELYNEGIYEIEIKGNIKLPSDCQPYSRLMAFFKGVIARQNKRQLSQNPYQEQTSFYKAWDHGWKSVNKHDVLVTVVG